MDTTPSRPRRTRRVIGAAGLLAAGAVAGAALMFGGTANAAISTAAAGTTGSTSTAPGSSASRPAMPAHGGATHESAEKVVTGTDASKAQAAAIKAAGGGTAGAVTSDFTGTGYEVTVTRNGTATEYHLDSSFNVQQGPGRGSSPEGTPPGGAPSNAPAA